MILVYDCAINGFQVGLFNTAGKLLNQRTHDGAFAHTEQLIPYIQSLLSAEHAHFNDLSHIITTNGPGSFTGMRAGLATAIGLKTALNIPVLTSPTLSTIAHTWAHTETPSVLTHITVVIDTKCGDFYHQNFSVIGTAVITLSEISIQKPENLNTNTLTLCPTETSLLAGYTLLPPSLAGIYAAALQTPSHTLDPLYVRNAHVNVK